MAAQVAIDAGVVIGVSMPMARRISSWLTHSAAPPRRHRETQRYSDLHRMRRQHVGPPRPSTPAPSAGRRGTYDCLTRRGAPAQHLRPASGPLPHGASLAVSGGPRWTPVGLAVRPAKILQLVRESHKVDFAGRALRVAVITRPACKLSSWWSELAIVGEAVHGG